MLGIPHQRRDRVAADIEMLELRQMGPILIGPSTFAGLIILPELNPVIS